MAQSSINDVTYYDITPLQQIIYMQQKYSLRKAICNIPMALTFEPQIDFELLKQAIRIEIERNDAMRLFFKKVKGGFVQYFKESYMPEDFKYYDFTGKTSEQQRLTLMKESEKAISIGKGIAPYEFIFFTSFDGKNGFYFKHHHLANDAGGIFIMLNDLMKVYVALLNNSELPSPLGSFEERLKKDLVKMEDESQNTRDIDFFTKYHQQFGISPIFAAAHNSRILDDYRKKKKDPTLRGCPSFAMIRSKSIQAIFNYGEDRTRQIEEFCRQQNVSLMTLFYLLIRTQSSKANHGEKDISYSVSNANRATLIEKRTSGMTLNTHFTRTVFEPEITAADALHRLNDIFTQFYHHNKLSGLYILGLINKIYPHKPIEGWNPGCFSYIPFMLELPDEWNYKLDWISAQTLAQPLFFGLIHDLKNHNIDLYIEYLIEYGTQEEVEWVNRNFLKMIDMMIADPNVTIQTMLDNMEEFRQ